MAYQNYIRMSETNIAKDSSNFWTYIENKERHSRIPGTIKNSEVTFDDEQKTVDGFGDYFNSDYVISDRTVPFPVVQSNLQLIDLKCITYDEIIKSTKKLKPN